MIYLMEKYSVKMMWAFTLRLTKIHDDFIPNLKSYL